MTDSPNRANSPSTPRVDESRRSFLAQTASLAGAAGLAGFASARVIAATPTGPAPIAAEPTPIAADGIIRMGVIGTGGMGTGHCSSFTAINAKRQDKVHIVALADVCTPRVEEAKTTINRTVDEAAKSFEEKKGDPDRSQKDVKIDLYSDYRKLLERKDIQGVLIASPEHWHAQMAIDAIAAGKDVYVEKPMTLDLADALKLYKVVNANPSIMFQVGTQQMQRPKFHEAKKMIAAGAIGKPTFSQTSYCRNSKDGEWLYYNIDPQWKPGVNLDWDAWCGPLGKAPWSPEIYARWRRYRKYSSGIIGDLLVHGMTPLMWAMDQGWPTRVVASGGHLIDKKMENPDQVNINVEFEKEHVMIVAGSTCNEQGLEVMVRGHKGTIRLGGKDCDVKPEALFADDFDAKTVQCPDIGDDQDAHRRAWLKSIRSRETPLTGVEIGTKVMVIVDLATRSMWDGHAYTFDPKTMTAKQV